MFSNSRRMWIIRWYTLDIHKSRNDNFFSWRATAEQELEAGTNSIATTGGIMNWTTSWNREEDSSKTDYIETVNSVVTEDLQTEITVNTASIATMQEELVILGGIAQVVNGLCTISSNC